MRGLCTLLGPVPGMSAGLTRLVAYNVPCPSAPCQVCPLPGIPHHAATLWTISVFTTCMTFFVMPWQAIGDWLAHHGTVGAEIDLALGMLPLSRMEGSTLMLCLFCVGFGVLLVSAACMARCPSLSRVCVGSRKGIPLRLASTRRFCVLGMPSLNVKVLASYTGLSLTTVPSVLTTLYNTHLPVQASLTPR